MNLDPSALIPALEELARMAGAAVMAVYAQDFAIRHKSDSSPVTEADTRAEAIILSGLRALTPDLAIVAEEEAAAGRCPIADGRPFWLVDPLDGTREFIDRNGEFTVNIALVSGGSPVAGVVLAPASGMMWSGAAGRAERIEADGRRRPIACRPRPASGLRVVSSRSHGRAEALSAWMATLPAPVLTVAGSSLKFCRLAEGEADLYPRFGPTHEWDTAAGHAVLLAAGGAVETLDGRPLAYGKPGYRNPDFIARGPVPT